MRVRHYVSFMKLKKPNLFVQGFSIILASTIAYLRHIDSTHTITIFVVFKHLTKQT